MPPHSHRTPTDPSEALDRPLPPRAADALARAATAEARNLDESSLLCAVLLTIAVVCVAWSAPASGAGAPFALLCLVLIAVEHRRARARFRRAVESAGEAHGLTAAEAKRAARVLAQACDTPR